jgi:hypothetical protein
MKAAGILLLCTLSVLAAGCASRATSERTVDATANAETKDRLQKAQEEKQRVADNWDKLHPAMTVDEVEAAIGPLDAGYKAIMTAFVMKKTPDIQVTFDNGPRGRLNTESGVPDGCRKSTYTYYSKYYILTFDWQGRLTDFRLR